MSCSAREGIVMNHKKLRRLYREERLQVRRRGGRKRALGNTGADGAAARPQPALEPGLPVAMRSPMAGASASWRSSTTSRANAWRWSPIPRCPACGSRASSTPSSPAAAGRRRCVSDNGTELTSMAILRWSQETAVEWHYIAPGKPQQNAFIESFNGRLRDELLNETLFTSLAHAREALAIWKDDYNTVRPHSGLGNLPPAAYAKRSAPGMQRDGTLRYIEGSAPRPVASPSQQGSNEPRTLPIAG